MSRAKRVNDLVEELLDKEPAEQAARLAEQSTQTREEVQELLTAHAEMGEDFLTRSAAERLAPEPLAPGTVVGSYTIVGVLGAGGGGTVYEAEQKNPQRRVALKVRESGLGSQSSLQRFRDEAQILARLQHPDIAHVYEAGVHDEMPYFAMEYVAHARDLIEHGCDLALFARICDAIQYGHEQGIVHRDLKPSNILVLPNGFPKVIDFGIASMEGLDAREGEIAGTPPYMSPEQRTAGGRVDERSDVYGLGVVLGQLLADSPPFELRAIVKKATTKDPAARYPSAAALGDDVRHYLAHHAVDAVRGGVSYRVWKLLRRHRIAAACFLVGLVAAVLALVGGGPPPSAPATPVPAELRRYATQIKLVREVLARDRARAGQLLEQVPEPMRGWEWRYLHGQLDVSTRRIEWPGVTRMPMGTISRDGRRGAAYGLADGEHTVRVWELDTGEVVRDIVVATALYSLAFAPDGDTIALGHFSGPVDLYGLATGQRLRRIDAHKENVTSMLFEPEGKWLATASKDRTVKLWAPETGALLRTLRGHRDRVICLALHGRRLATGGRDGRVLIWDLAQESTPLIWDNRSGTSIEGVAFRPDGKALVTASRDGRVRVWAIGRSTWIDRAHHTDVARGIAFSPKGETFATASWDGTVRVWASGGQALASLGGHEGQVMAAFYRGDELVSFGTEGTLRFWDAHRVDSIRAHGRAVLALAFSPDGGSLASADEHAVVAWEVGAASLRKVTSFKWQAGAHPRLDYRDRIYCVGANLIVWRPGKELYEAGPSAGFVLAQDGKRGYSARGNGLEVWAIDARASTLKESVTLLRRTDALHEAPITAIAVHPHGAWLAAGDGNGEIRRWRLRDLARRGRTERTGVAVQQLVFSPDGRRVAALWKDGEVRVLDAETLKTVARTAGPEERTRAVAFSPDGTRLATGGNDKTVRLWHVETGQQLLEFAAPSGVPALAFSPDGRVLAAGGGTMDRRYINLWRIR